MVDHSQSRLLRLPSRFVVALKSPGLSIAVQFENEVLPELTPPDTNVNRLPEPIRPVTEISAPFQTSVCALDESFDRT